MPVGFPPAVSQLGWGGERGSGAEAPILTVRGGALPDFSGPVSCHASCEARFPGCFQEKSLVP